VKRTAFILLLTIGIAACKKLPQPEPLHPEDICAICKMAVTEQHFAAQALLPNGDYVKFDDIGCLMNYSHRPKLDSIWFGDYELEKWIRADSAYLLKTDSVRTPMGYGVLAFSNLDSFQLAIKNLNGKQITLEK